MKRLQSLSAAVLFWGALVGGSAQANTIEITPVDVSGSNIGNFNPVSVSFSNDSVVGFVQNMNAALFLAGTADQSAATGFGFPNDFQQGGSPAAEAAYLSLLTGVTFTALNADIDPSSLPGYSPFLDNGEDEHFTFTTTDAFFALKADGWIAYFHNTGGQTTVLYDALNGGAGLSHYQAFFVPGPIVGAGLPGLVMACGGLLALARRRRKLVV